MTWLNILTEALQCLVLLLAFGLLADWPELCRKKHRRNCRRGQHRWGEWHSVYHIHNGNEIWERKCKDCYKKQEDIGKLPPVQTDDYLSPLP